MTINAQITDAQGAAQAKHFQIKAYTDGNHLLAQITASLDLQTQKQSLMTKIATAKSLTELNAALAPAPVKPAAPAKPAA